MRVCCIVLSLVLFGIAAQAEPLRVDRAIIVLEADASPTEQNVAELLQRRLLEVSTLPIAVGPLEQADTATVISLGVLRPSGRLHDLASAQELELPSRAGTVFPEGFVISATASPPAILAIAADERGLLYAAGEIVRRFHYEADHLSFEPYTVASAPAYRYRGSSTNQGGTMMKITGARGWTTEELHAAVLEYGLAGANTFYASDEPSPIYDFMKSFDFMTVTGARPNQLRGEFPEAWKAGGRESWEGKNWVCPNIPEAHDALIKQWEEDFAKRADHEVMRFYAGDPGGCTDERCTPWGKSFIHLCEELAAIWLKHHPNSTVQVANQGLDNAGDQAIFEYYRAAPRPWSYGICYGPGSNAMSDYFRDFSMRDDLFAYPGSGPVNRYVSEILRELPGDQRLVHYSDITHYISAQFEAENPEPNLVKSYGRRTFHARPKAMYRTFQAIMPFSEGDIIYSEGNHDEFHQYLWARMLWNPNRELEDLMMEYCTLYFGPEAAPLMLQALLQLEVNLEAPLVENEGIAKYYDLVQEAGKQMPAWRMERDYKWRLHMQKAALDKYIQDKLRNELDKEKRIRALLEPIPAPEKLPEALKQALAITQEPLETKAMKPLREQAGKLGEETNQRHGDRITGYFRLDQSLRDLPGTAKLLEEAAEPNADTKTLITKALEHTNAPTNPGRIFW